METEHEPSPSSPGLQRRISTKSTVYASQLDAQPSLPRSYRWRPSFWRPRPMIGIAALLIAVIALIVSLAILLGSDGQLVAAWSFQPTVYLAIATAVSTAALQCALAQAAPISWWYKALRGSSVEDLELNYEAGESFFRALLKSFRYRRFSMFTMASLAIALMLINGPLLQRASRVTRVSRESDVLLNVSIVPQVPSGFSGTFDLDSFSYTQSPATIDVGYTWATQEPMEVDAYCDGVCHTTIHGPGMALVECFNQSWPVNKTMLRHSNMTWGQRQETPSNYNLPSKPLIYSTYLVETECNQVPGREATMMLAGNANYENCEGGFQLSSCVYTPAILEYEVKIQGHTISFVPSAHGTRVVALANNTCTSDPESSTRLLAVALLSRFLLEYQSCNAQLSLNYNSLGQVVKEGPVESWESSSFSAYCMQYVRKASWNVNGCAFLSRNPLDDMVAAMNELMFRAGLMTAHWKNVTSLIDPGLETHQLVQAKSTKDENVYSSDLRWFASAAAIQVLAIILLMPSFYGWWKIGCELSLSPFQMAKAFGSPLFASINSGAGATGIVKNAGRWRLRLGVIDDGVSEATEKDMLYTNSRVGIDHSDGVSAPQKGLYTPY